MEDTLQKWHLPYEPEKLSNDQLRDDIRLFVAAYSNLKQGVVIDRGDGTPLTKDYLISMAAAAYSELAKRKQKGKVSYKVNKDKSKIYEEFWNEVRHELTKQEIEILEKALTPDYYSVYKPKYRFFEKDLDEQLESVGWNQKELLVQVKFNGMRVTLGKVKGESFVYVDPEDLKRKSPRIDSKLPLIKKELENLEDNTILDGELIGIKDGEALHRTFPNSVINSNEDPEIYQDFLFICVFDIFFFEGEDLRKKTQQERLSVLEKVNKKSYNHIWICKTTSNLNERAEGYITKNVQKAINNIKKDFNSRNIKKLSEGVMFKLLDVPLPDSSRSVVQTDSWGKFKFLSELDVRPYNRRLVKGSNQVYNYYIGLDITSNYAKKMLEDKEASKHVVYLKPDKTSLVGLETQDYLDKKEGWFLMDLGKTDNTKGDYKIGDSIIRIAAEDVLRNENLTNPDAPYYTTYVAVVLEEVPEKDVTDSLDTVEKLSQQEPKSLNISDIKRRVEKDGKKDQDDWEVSYAGSKTEHLSVPSQEKGKEVQEIIFSKYASFMCPSCGKTATLIVQNEQSIVCPSCNRIIKTKVLTPDVYKQIRKPLEPLPKEYYVDYKEAKTAFCQIHYRGLPKEKTEKFKKGEISLAELVETHSAHMDLRIKWEDGPFMQLVLTQDNAKDYIRTLAGENDPKTNNVAKALVTIKPSALEPTIRKAKSDEILLDKEGSELLTSYDVSEESYIIPAGEVGAMGTKDAYMSLIWEGTAKSGVMREDLKEIFLYPSKDLPEKNQKLLNGRFIVRAFKQAQGTVIWFWKAKDDPYPLNSYCHIDRGDFKLKKPENIKHFGHESYPEWKNRKEVCGGQ